MNWQGIINHAADLGRQALAGTVETPYYINQMASYQSPSTLNKAVPYPGSRLDPAFEYLKSLAQNIAGHEPQGVGENVARMVGVPNPATDLRLVGALPFLAMGGIKNAAHVANKVPELLSKLSPLSQKVMYHGTDANFDIFSLNNFGRTDEGFAGKGIYFSGDKPSAKEYGKNIKEALLDIKTPYIYETMGEPNPAFFRESLGLNKNANSVEVRNELIRQGYDGVVINQIDKDGNIIMPNSEVMVLGNKQIKNIKKDNDIYNVFGADVYKNPDSNQLDEIRERFKANFGSDSKDPKIRYTYDKDGNEYAWMSGDLMHYPVEKWLWDNERILTHQAKDFDAAKQNLVF